MRGGRSRYTRWPDGRAVPAVLCVGDHPACWARVREPLPATTACGGHLARLVPPFVRLPGVVVMTLLLLLGAGAVVLPISGSAAGRRAGRLARGHPALRQKTRGSRLSQSGAGVASGLAVVVLIGRWWAIPVGLIVGTAVARYLRRRTPAVVREARRQAIADLPLGADLLAAALRTGAPVDRAAAAVADALGGPLGERLGRTARSLRLGGGAGEAWAHLSDVPGADRLITAAVRSSASGGALAGALTRLADDLRADRTVAAEAAARRAGVLIVLPLGLCFLPAFLLAGLVPVVVAVLGDVL